MRRGDPPAPCESHLTVKKMATLTVQMFSKIKVRRPPMLALAAGGGVGRRRRRTVGGSHELVAAAA